MNISPHTNREESVPWHIWGVVLAATLYATGFYWDISWHQTIGRDSFFNPAHVAIYLCGVVGGLSCAYIILSTTFGNDQSASAASVKICGFCGPFGAFIVAWGGIAMLTAAPFDNWWHNAYGLDAKLNSPPHWVLTSGVFAVQIGGIVLLAGAMNRSAEKVRERLAWLELYLGATIIALPLALMNNRVLQHSALFYAAAAAAVPLVMIATASASGRHWGCATVGAIYTTYVLAFTWILPLFHGSPRLGPVYRQVTQFVPPSFPALLIVPAFFMDYVRDKWATWDRWKLSLSMGIVFVATFIAVQWPFANFLMSPHSRNWIFATQHFPYFIPPSAHLVRNEFVLENTRIHFLIGMAAAVAIAVTGCRIGMACGDWLRHVQR
jgi:hypothetical protein